MVPLCDLRQQYENLKEEFDSAICEVAAGGHYVLGPNVKALEQEVAEYCGARFASGVGNGTDALHLALRALRIGPGDEVITTPFTFVATTEAIALVGATPVFVDIDPATFNIDPAAIEPAITERTKAILPVHLYGQPCDMDAIMEIAQRRGLFVVEDCAQAIGAKWKGRQVGTFGDAGCFSFFPSKNLGCMGDGGMVISNDEEVYRRVEMLRRHGGAVKYFHSEIGINSRLDEMQAAILRIKLPHLDDWIAARRGHAYRYNSLLSQIDGIAGPREKMSDGLVLTGVEESQSDCCHAVYHQYTMLVDDRDEWATALGNAGIGHAIYYPVPLHLQEVHAPLGYRPGAFPVTETTAARCLSLPMFPELATEQQDQVVECLRAHASKRKTERAA